MPTYEYECSDCGHTFERFQRMSDKPQRKCPSCGTLKAKRLLGTGAAVIFKGSGFYVNDYGRSKGYHQEKKKESASSDAPASETKAKDTPAKSDND